jgi:hypothetical protein
MNVDLTRKEIVRLIEMCHDMIDINRQALKQGRDPTDEIGTEEDTRFLINLGDKLRQAKE